MIDALDLAAQRWLHFLADWSLRWGALLLILWLWFTLRPPRTAAVRYLLLCVALAVGLALPLVPRWGPGWIAASAVAPQNPLLVSDTPEPGRDRSPKFAPTRPITQELPETEPITAPTAAPHSHAVPPAPPSARSSPPQTAASTPWQRPALHTVLAALWAVGALAFAVRLLFGRLTLRRLRRESLSLSGPAMRLFEQVRDEIGLRRRARLAVHRDVASPLLIGGMTPLVLVPAEWQNLPARVQRSCLLHELAHLARGDDWVRSLLEWLRTVLSFHPLVHWLLWRCRHEQELLSDESVVRAGVDADAYARTLSDFASRLSARIRPAARCAGQALPFLALASVTTRIRKLMEDPVPPRPTLSQRCRLAAAMALVFTFAVALGTARLRALEPPRTGPVASNDRKTSGPERPHDTAPAPEEPAQAPADEELAKATQRALAFLRAQQADDGTWNSRQFDRWKIGLNALCTLALLQSGVKPDDPQLAKALDHLAAAEPPTMIYELSLQTLALCAADPKRYRDTTQRNAELLARGQITQGKGRGGWSYDIDSGGLLDLGGDGSNSEFAVWSLDEAARAGAQVDPEVWRRAHEYWKQLQNEDGSWGYTPGSQGTGSMTTSGIASITIAQTRLAEADKQFVPEDAPAARGWNWMARNFAIGHNPASGNWLMYYLMTLRRAADLTGKEAIGDHQWYREGRDFLLRSQDAETGAWKGTGSMEREPLVATSMALLFLNPPPQPAPERTEQGEQSEADAKRQPRLDFSVVVARHALLLEGKQIVTWKQIAEKIAALPDPSKAHSHFYITRGAREAGVDKAARDEIWRLHGDYKLAGHSLGSLWPRSDLRYDRIKTPADVEPDDSLRVEGRVVGPTGRPAAGVEIILVTPVDESIAYKSYHIALVQGRVRNPLEHVLTHSDQDGRFAVYPPNSEPFSIVALHPQRGFALVGANQFRTGHEVQLLEWAGLVSEFAEEPEKQDASLTTHVRESDGRPEIVFNQYWSDLKDRQPTLRFGFTHVPPILETTISRNFPGDDGSSFSLPGASVSLLPGETRRLDLGPLSKQQREHLEQMRRRLQQRREPATSEDATNGGGQAAAPEQPDTPANAGNAAPPGKADLTVFEQHLLLDEERTISDIRQLRELKDVQAPILHGDRISDDDLRELADDTPRMLGFVRTNVKGPGLKHLNASALESLQLVGTHVTDAWLENLPQVPTLRGLTLSDSRITDAGLKHLRKLPNLTWLNVSGTRIGDTGMKHIAALSRLEHLNLNDTLVSDEGLASVKSLPGLTYFSLSSPNVRGPGLVHLLGAQRLERLQFTGAHATDEWLRHVEPLRTVTWMELHSTSITDKGLGSLSQWKALREIYLNRNQTTRAGESELRRALPGASLRR